MNNINKDWLIKGFVDEPIDKNIDLIDAIKKIKSEKNVCLMVHYYQDPEIQDIADIIGDSLALAQKASNVDANIILLAGVYFMGETVKILNPNKKVLITDLNSGCSLADSCKPNDFKQFISQHPDHKVISYVNTSAEIKALSDIVVTSTNALKIVESFPKNQKLIFGPDKNLGSYINKLTGRNMLLWDGSCHVHQRFSIRKSLELKQSSNYQLICHPECSPSLVEISDYVGSTAALLKYVGQSSCKNFIVATEIGILHQMQKNFPNKIFISAPVDDDNIVCNKCEYMRLTSLQKIYLTLKFEWPEILVSNELAISARRSIDNMLNIS